jgi:hypothetical protein
MLKDAQNNNETLGLRIFRLKLLKRFISNPSKLPLPYHKDYKDGAPSLDEMKQLNRILHLEISLSSHS